LGLILWEKTGRRTFLFYGCPKFIFWREDKTKDLKDSLGHKVEEELKKQNSQEYWEREHFSYLLLYIKF